MKPKRKARCAGIRWSRHRNVMLPMLAVAFGFATTWAGQVSAQTATSAAPQAGAAASTTLGEIPVTASPLNGDGSTPESGNMYVPNPSFGPFGNTPAQDIPFSTNTIPQEVLQNQQVHSAAEALKNDPSVRAFPPTNAFAQNYIIRGFLTNPAYGIFQDGLDLGTYTNPAIETESRVDILKGAASVLYGFAAPAGVVNYSSKLPLEAPLTELDVGYISRATADEQFDISRRFGNDNQFGARLTVYQQDGATSVDRTTSDRNVQQMSLDWKPNQDVRVWGLVEHDDFRATGGNSTFFLAAPLASLPSAPNPLGLYGQPWNYNYFDNTREEAGLDFSRDGWTVRLAVGHVASLNTYDGNFDSPSLGNTGAYGVTANRGQFGAWSTAYRGLLSKTFAIGPVKQTISLVADGSDHIFHQDLLPNGSVPLGLSSLANPTYFAQPSLPMLNYGLHYNLRLDSQTLSDRIDIGDYVTLFGGGVRSAIDNVTYSLPSYASSTRLYADKITPLAAVEVKPWKTVTFYASYIQALEPGATAPTTAVNASQTLPPFVGEQYEVGVKSQVRPGLEINAALFRISQAYSYLNPANVFVENGTQTNQGFEVTATGRITPDLAIFSGFSAISPKLAEQAGYQSGLAPGGVSDFRLNVYAEYKVPPVRGLTLLGGVYYASRFAAQENTAANVARGYPSTVYAPGAVTLDIGARYDTAIANTPITVRAYLENAFNEAYWVSSNGLANIQIGQPITGKLTVSAYF